VTLVYYNFMVTSAFQSGFSIFFLCDVVQNNRQHVFIYWPGKKIILQRQSRKYSSWLQSAGREAQFTFIILNATYKDDFQALGKQDIAQQLILMCNHLKRNTFLLQKETQNNTLLTQVQWTNNMHCWNAVTVIHKFTVPAGNKMGHPKLLQALFNFIFSCSPSMELCNCWCKKLKGIITNTQKHLTMTWQ
jgi:hypothetical protein